MKIPEQIIVDTTSWPEGQKINFIKALREYSNLSLKEAKEISESGESSFNISRRRGDDEMVAKGLDALKRLGVKIKYVGMDDKVKSLAIESIEFGNYDLAIELLNILKKG